eukprot:7986475-Pyramimonas_sp.AAC.1
MLDNLSDTNFRSPPRLLAIVMTDGEADVVCWTFVAKNHVNLCTNGAAQLSLSADDEACHRNSPIGWITVEQAASQSEHPNLQWWHLQNHLQSQTLKLTSAPARIRPSPFFRRSYQGSQKAGRCQDCY